MTDLFQTLALIDANKILAWLNVQQARYMAHHKLKRKLVTQASLRKYAVRCCAGINLAADKAKTQKQAREILDAVNALLDVDATTFLRAR